MYKHFKRASSLLVAALLVFTIGCSDDDEGTPMMGPDLGEGSQLRVVHNSPDAPPVDIYVKGNSAPVATGVAFGDVTPYLDLVAGNYTFELRAAGALPNTPPAFETPELTIPDDVTITAMAMGLLNSSDDADKFRVVPLVENFTAPGAGKIAVRIIHASADAPTVGIDVGDDGNAELTLDRFGDSGEAGVELDANTSAQVAIWSGSTRVTGFTIPALPSGTEVFVVASGLLADLPREATGFQLWAIGSEPSATPIKQNPTVFALHGSPDAPRVDVYVGGTNVKLIDNLGFGELSGAVQVPPGSYDLDFKATGSSATAATLGTPTLAAGERYLAIASGFLTPEVGAEAFQLLAYADMFDPEASAAELMVLHASPDAPAVDVGPSSSGVVTPVPDFTNIPFKGASPDGGTTLSPGALTIGVAVTTTTNAVAEFDVTLSGGLRAYAAAIGTLGSDGESFRLAVVNTSVFPWVAAEVLPNP